MASSEEYNGVQKAAILLIALGPEKSASIFKHLKEEEIEELTLEIVCFFQYVGILHEILSSASGSAARSASLTSFRYGRTPSGCAEIYSSIVSGAFPQKWLCSRLLNVRPHLGHAHIVPLSFTPVP